jgi:hypothetical protein
MDRSDFFVATEPWIFDFLRGRRFSAVLQAGAPSDDGSLSVYCARQRIPYINVEARFGHLAEQVRMLEALQELPT